MRSILSDKRVKLVQAAFLPTKCVILLYVLLWKRCLKFKTNTDLWQKIKATESK